LTKAVAAGEILTFEDVALDRRRRPSGWGRKRNSGRGM